MKTSEDETRSFLSVGLIYEQMATLTQACAILGVPLPDLGRYRPETYMKAMAELRRTAEKYPTQVTVCECAIKLLEIEMRRFDSDRIPP